MMATPDSADVSLTVTGGTGHDLFIADLNSFRFDANSMAVVTGFDPAVNQLAIAADPYHSPADYSYAVTPDPGGAFTDLAFVYQPTHDSVGSIHSTMTVRLIGVTDLPADAVGMVPQNTFDAIQDFVRADAIKVNVPVFGTGAAESIVGDGQHITFAYLGGGNDSYSAQGESHYVSMGQGDDHYTGHGLSPNLSPDATFFQSVIVQTGAGADALDIGQEVGAYYGGDGNDTLVADVHMSRQMQAKLIFIAGVVTMISRSDLIMSGLWADRRCALPPAMALTL